MKKLKIITVIGTRPEIIRLSRVIVRLDLVADHILVHTGQNYDYELNEAFFDDLELRTPDYFLECADDNSSQAMAISKLILKFDEVLKIERPDAVLVLGDTNSCLSVISAKKRRIPIFHMEAGNRCFDDRVPEEINRRIVDHISDINMPYSSISREYLLAEGLPADRVIKTGSPMYEVLNHYKAKISESTILGELRLEAKNYFVFSTHRYENIENPNNLHRIISILNNIAEKFSFPILVSTHPRFRKALSKAEFKIHEAVQFLNPFKFTDYVALQQNALAVLSDSGTITEEASILKFPALNLRDTHERPEGMEEAQVMMVGLNCERILQAINVITEQSSNFSKCFHTPEDYIADNVSIKVSNIIHSYRDYVISNVYRDVI